MSRIRQNAHRSGTRGRSAWCSRPAVIPWQEAAAAAAAAPHQRQLMWRPLLLRFCLFACRIERQRTWLLLQCLAGRLQRHRQPVPRRRWRRLITAAGGWPGMRCLWLRCRRRCYIEPASSLHHRLPISDRVREMGRCLSGSAGSLTKHALGTCCTDATIFNVAVQGLAFSV